jgi:tRNA pseudouridine13 synthase
MQKTNTDTMSAIFMLSKATGRKLNVFGFAGTKDKRGVTTQRVSVFAINKHEIVHQLSNLHNVQVGNFVESKEPIKLGDLQGNRFCLAIRDLKCEKGFEELTKSNYL